MKKIETSPFLKNRNVPIFRNGPIVAAACVATWLTAGPAQAQSSNGVYTVHLETVSSGGGKIGGGNPMSAQTMLGQPAGGTSSNGTYLLRVGTGAAAKTQPPLSKTVTISGTINDPTSALTVNGTPATISGTTFAAPGIQLVGGANTITAVATDPYGNASSHAVVVYLDVPAAQKTPRFNRTVQGTINESTATVTVNGVAATVSSGQFSASVPLTTGVNALTALATDLVGNTSTASIHVYVPPPGRLPAKPTVGTYGPAIPSVTTANAVTIGGTKTAGTSIWINGQSVVVLNDELTWSAAISLSEGDNVLTIIAKDTIGATSAATIINVIRDAAAPVVNFSPPAKTNLNPVTLTGTVDDSLTVVKINGITASRTGTAFDTSIQLIFGANTLQLEATSPNSYRTTQTKTITLGTVPTMGAVTPATGTILPAQAAVTILMSATDQENDAIQFQVLLDGTILLDWASSASRPWTPDIAQTGLHTLTINARDDYGGSNGKNADVFVVRPPVDHP